MAVGDIEVDALIALNFLLSSAEELKLFKRKLRRRWWVHPAIRNREEVGYTNSLVPILRDLDPSLYTNFLRLSPTIYENLLKAIAPAIVKNDTNFRKSIPVNTRLQLTLRYLATGEKFNSLCFQFRVGRTTVGLIVKQTCQAIWNILGPMYLKFPQNECEWKLISEDFYTKWQLPNCLGAIDGKHVIKHSHCDRI